MNAKISKIKTLPEIPEERNVSASFAGISSADMAAENTLATARTKQSGAALTIHCRNIGSTSWGRMVL